MSSNYCLQSLSPLINSFVDELLVEAGPTGDVALRFLYRVGSLRLFGSSDGTFENISTKFTHISQKWSYFTVHYTFYLHISLGRCNWLRCRGGAVLLAHPVSKPSVIPERSYIIISLTLATSHSVPLTGGRGRGTLWGRGGLLDGLADYMSGVKKHSSKYNKVFLDYVWRPN